MQKEKMNISMLKNYIGKTWFVFLITSFIFCVSLFSLDYYYLATNDSRITFLFYNMNNSKHHEEITTTPTNFTSTIINSHPLIKDNSVLTKLPPKKLDHCLGQYIYVYDLPSSFNKDFLNKCTLKWESMCPNLSNLGLGPKIIEKSKKKVLSKQNWYATNQFSLEVIFHNIMKNYKCLTNDSSLASAIYVPYYAGLDIGKYLWEGFNVSIRDESPKRLMKWLTQQPQWKNMYGKDHFMVLGRIGYDFRRITDENNDWGTKLMFLPEAKNMSFLLIESCGSYDNEFAIPYPTYFHPTKDVQILEWQKKMRRMKRKYLFSFVGAPRPNSTSIRNMLIKQCESSKSCKLVGCYLGVKNKDCGNAVDVMDAFRNSVFCLQPPGDSFTRRSIFDSILAGCIPVFFHPQSAYKQYLWHFPKNDSSYSVFIPEIDVKENRVMINETLFKVSKREVLAMREEVIRLIPKIVYRNPKFKLETFEDAFDITVKKMLKRIEEIRREITNVTYS